MTLIEDIQNAAVDASNDLGTLLRKCKLFAARLGSQPLEDWLLWESNGYPEDIKVPDYRVWPAEVKGHFSGPYGSGLTNISVPFVCLPEKTRKYYEHYECRQSVASIEALLVKDSSKVCVSTGNLALILGTKVYKGQNCIEAWAEFGTGDLVELLNSVRNRILDFALAIWKEEPTAGEPGEDNAGTLESSKVTQIFNTAVYGGAANIVYTANNSPFTFNIRIDDIPSLEEVLRKNEVSEEDIGELKDVLVTDARPASAEQFGPGVSSWIAKMLGKAANGSWKIGLGAAGNLLAQAISKFYGL